MVTVKDVIFQDLKPVVAVVAVQDDISLAAKHDVPLQDCIPQRNRKVNVWYLWQRKFSRPAQVLLHSSVAAMELWWWKPGLATYAPWSLMCCQEQYCMRLSRIFVYYWRERGEIKRKIHVAKGEANTDEIIENNALEMMELYIWGEDIKR